MEKKNSILQDVCSTGKSGRDERIDEIDLKQSLRLLRVRNLGLSRIVPCETLGIMGKGPFRKPELTCESFPLRVLGHVLS